MSLYLKYRPNDFNSLVGQDFIKNTLSKAVLNDKLVGGYLLCGPRGTGKTSTARIFAKAINCIGEGDIKPCNSCTICKSFNEGRLIDIIEIDAASNTGVDNIRDLIERAQFSPTLCKYKVYIIDEVHMLSNGAFNALLKILEEPPSHLKFILATTEVNKIPETILSRTQRYDFKRISNIDIKNRLEYISKLEGLTIDDKSYDFILNNSGGGLRNAISLLEQYILDGTVKYENIISNLGLVSDTNKIEFHDKLINGDESVIKDFDKIIDSGINIRMFIKDLIFLFKDNILSDIHGVNINKSIYIIDLLQKAYTESKNSFDEVLYFTITIIKIIKGYSESNIQTDNIINDVKITNNTNLEKPITKSSISNNISSNQDKEISTNDITDVFGDTLTNDDVEINIDNNISSNNNLFNVDNFISEVKTCGGKGGLTMSLRGSKIILDGEKLIINTSTSISKNQVLDNNNKDIMNNALKNIGFDNITLTIN